MSIFLGIVAQAQQNELVRVEEEAKADREQRRILRLQAEHPGVSASELIALIGGVEEKIDDLQLPRDEEQVYVPRTNGFPPPPSGPKSGAG